MKKNNKLPIIIVVVILLVIGGFFVLANINKTNAPTMTQDQNGQQMQAGQAMQEQEGGSFMGALKDVIAKGTAFKCTSSVDTESGQGVIEGTVQGNNYLGKANVQGKMANILMKENCMWTWEEGKTNGFKTCFELAEGQTSMWGQYNQAALDANVNCAPTVVGPGTFNPPANVNFIDMDQAMDGQLSEEQMQQLEQMSEDY